MTGLTREALNLLYEAATLNSQDMEVDILLKQFMRSLSDICRAQAAVVRQLQGSNLIYLTSHGIDRHSPLCQAAISQRRFKTEELGSANAVSVRYVETSPEDLGLEKYARDERGFKRLCVITLPVFFRDSLLGAYQFFCNPDHETIHGLKRFLTTIGFYLGSVIQQRAEDEERGRLLMVEERARVANELHDSLAQTFASLKFQVRVLDETLHQGGENPGREEFEKLHAQVESANLELRSLISRFRAPLQAQEVVVAVARQIEQFRKNTGIFVYLQNDWNEDDLSVEARSDVIGIVQEALANIRKHADAATVRVLLVQRGPLFRVVIEDDGCGITKQPCHSVNGHHVGQAIMRQRAQNLGATFQIDSEPGEGTRVSVEFEWGMASQ